MDEPYSAMTDSDAATGGDTSLVASPIVTPPSTDTLDPPAPMLASSSSLQKSPSTSLLHSDDADHPRPPSLAVTYDSLLERAGVGAFHYQLLLLCGWANAADAVEILAASFIMYAAQDDLRLSDSDKGWIGAMVFLGMLLGGWVWGSLADRLGRKSCLMLALLMNSVGGLAAAFVGTYHGMLLCRLVAGLGVGGSIPVIFTYFIEFLPTSARGQYMVYLAWFWMVGAIFTAAVAWAVIPLDMSTAAFIVTPFHSWRLFTLICALPSLTCAALLTWCPESPRFLLTQRRTLQAKRILTDMFAINHPALFGGVGVRAEWCGLCCLSERERVGQYDVVDQDEVEPIAEDEQDAPVTDAARDEERKEDSTDEDGVKAAFERELAKLTLDSTDGDGLSELTVPSYTEELSALLDKTRVLFTGRSLRASLLLMVTWFGLSFGYYGITLWIPETFAHLNPNAQSVLDPYSSAFLSAACNLPGNVVSVYTVRTLGRTLTLSTSVAASTLAVLLVPFASSPWAVTLVLSIFTLVSVGAWNALNICTTELYDTGVRSTAFGVMAAVGRMGAILGNVLFGEFIGGNVVVPMMITAAFLLSAAIASWRLRETKDDVLL